MQKRRLISITLEVLMATVIVVIIVTFYTTKHLRAQTEAREAPSSIHSEPVTKEGEAITVLPNELDMTMFDTTGGMSIAAYGDYVFVVRGNTLYQFHARDLKLVNKVDLEQTNRSIK
ncbi:MAG: hypothetical protein A2173_00390 [Planctomycetes bacterium RBG_13_44_8b]|nr:MAG: hypothetical protein A2173_00390 [Planctomycetes bacterium RBG_13_44_8b]